MQPPALAAAVGVVVFLMGQNLRVIRAFDFKAIYPGTKWCGSGNIANGKDDLGRIVGTDKCCRAHDLCPGQILPRQTRFGITNTNKKYFTWSQCSCDDAFYNCLKDVSGEAAADILGGIFFDVLNLKCVYYGYPWVCKKFLGIRTKNCKFDTSKSQAWRTREFPKKYTLLGK